ncbi:unnamed protein product [Urochloa humidicola]
MDLWWTEEGGWRTGLLLLASHRAPCCRSGVEAGDARGRPPNLFPFPSAPATARDPRDLCLGAVAARRGGPRSRGRRRPGRAALVAGDGAGHAERRGDARGQGRIERGRRRSTVQVLLPRAPLLPNPLHLRCRRAGWRTANLAMGRSSKLPAAEEEDEGGRENEPNGRVGASLHARGRWGWDWENPTTLASAFLPRVPPPPPRATTPRRRRRLHRAPPELAPSRTKIRRWSSPRGTGPGPRCSNSPLPTTSPLDPRCRPRRLRL